MSFPDTDPWDSSAPLSAQASKSGRGLFGKKRAAAVEGAAGDELEQRLRFAEGRAQAAESKVSHLESELRSYDDAISTLQTRVESLADQAGPARLASLMQETAKDEPLVADWGEPGEGEGADASFHALSQELAGIMTGAEDRAAQIIARAWTAAQTRAHEVDRMRQDVREEIDGLNRWREDVDGAMRSLVGDMAQAKATIEEIPERVRLALAPAADAMALVDERMSRLAETTIPLGEALPSPSPEPEPVSGTQADRAEAEDPPSRDVADPGAPGPHLDLATVLDEEHEEAIAAATETLSILAGSSDDGSYEPLEGFGSA